MVKLGVQLAPYTAWQTHKDVSQLLALAIPRVRVRPVPEDTYCLVLEKRSLVLSVWVLAEHLFHRMRERSGREVAGFELLLVLSVVN